MLAGEIGAPAQLERIYRNLRLDSRANATIYTLPVTPSALRIGEVAERAGVSVDTVRYYEKRKLLPRAARSVGGFRIFSSDAIKRVRFIKQAQEVGLSLDDIKTMLAGGGEGECQQMRDLLLTKQTEINARVKMLREFSRTLARLLRACEEELARHGNAAKCPAIVEISRVPRKGGR